MVIWMGDSDQVVRGSVRFTEADLSGGLTDMTPISRLYRFICPGFLAAALLGEVCGGEQARPLTVFLAGAAAFYAMVLVARWRHAGTMLRTQHLDEGNVEYRLDDQGITICAPGRSASISYRVMHRFCDGDTSFLLYAGPCLANIVPKRAFQPEDLPRIHAFLSRNVQPHRPFGPWQLLALMGVTFVAFVGVWTVLFVLFHR
jgi:hypothetical protein